MLQAFLASSRLHQDPSHGLGCGSKEMSAPVPLLRWARANQTQVSLMHQRRRLERMPRGFTGHFVRRQPSEFLINDRKQFIGCFRVAVFDGLKDVGDVTHPDPEGECSWRG